MKYAMLTAALLLSGCLQSGEPAAKTTKPTKPAKPSILVQPTSGDLTGFLKYLEEAVEIGEFTSTNHMAKTADFVVDKFHIETTKDYDKFRSTLDDNKPLDRASDKPLRDKLIQQIQGLHK